MTLPSITVITVNFNEPIATNKLINCIRISGLNNVEIIVVDNSDDHTRQLPESTEYRRIITKNRGYAAALNRGISEAKGEMLLLTNNDITFNQESIHCLVATLENNPDYGAVSPVILTKHTLAVEFAGFTRISPFTARNRTLLQIDDGTITQTPYLHGACMLIRRKILPETGLLPEIYFLYYEEIEWSENIRKAGYSLGVANTCRILHEKSLSISRLTHEGYYYLFRNRILFQRRTTQWFHQMIYLIYLVFISVPFNLIRNLLTGNRKLNRQLLNALAWNLRYKSMSDGTI